MNSLRQFLTVAQPSRLFGMLAPTAIRGVGLSSRERRRAGGDLAPLFKAGQLRDPRGRRRGRQQHRQRFQPSARAATPQTGLEHTAATRWPGPLSEMVEFQYCDSSA